MNEWLGHSVCGVPGLPFWKCRLWLSTLMCSKSLGDHKLCMGLNGSGAGPRVCIPSSLLDMHVWMFLRLPFEGQFLGTRHPWTKIKRLQTKGEKQ